MPDMARLHPINRRHLETLTSTLDSLELEAGSPAAPTDGRRVDDVARAVQVDLLHAITLGWPAVADSLERGLALLEEASPAEGGRFRNVRAADGTWSTDSDANQSLGRTILALGEVIARSPNPDIVERAIVLFGRALPEAAKVASPRAQAAVILGCAAVARSAAVTRAATPRDKELGEAATLVMRRLATGLHAEFLWAAGPGWPWLEQALTYENALIPRALIVAGGQLGADAMRAIGLQVVDWLISIQTAPEGHLSPIGHGSWERLGDRPKFDQHPIEATALLLAADAALSATGHSRYRAAMERAYAWFLGRNDLRRKVAHTSRGASSNALTAKGIDPGEGAESTLMWLIAAEHIRAMRAASQQHATEAAAPA